MYATCRQQKGIILKPFHVLFNNDQPSGCQLKEVLPSNYTITGASRYRIRKELQKSSLRS
jgi:hypothetical protein